MSGLHHYERKQNFLLITLADFNIGTHGDTTNVQMTFDLCPHFAASCGLLQSHVPHEGLQIPNILFF
jgi:hypothetical protein